MKTLWILALCGLAYGQMGSGGYHPPLGGGVSGGAVGGASNLVNANAVTCTSSAGVLKECTSAATIPALNKVTLTVPSTGATFTLADNSSLITAGAFATTITSTAISNFTLPAGSTTGVAGGNSLTNADAVTAVTSAGAVKEAGAASTIPNLSITANGAVSAPGFKAIGTWFTGGTGTTTFPHILLEATGTTASTTWSTAGTGIGVNAVTGFTGNLIDLKLAGSTKFSVNSTGGTVVNGAGTMNSSSWNFLQDTTGLTYNSNASISLKFVSNGITASNFGDFIVNQYNGTSYAQVLLLKGTQTTGTGVATLGTGTIAALHFGGDTSSFPAIKRSSTTAQFRLADDSADAPISFSGMTGSGSAIVLSGLGASTGSPSSLCLNTTTVTVNAALTCTVSSRIFKTHISAMHVPNATGMLMKLIPTQFAYKEHPDQMRWGFVAEQVAKVDPKLADAFDKQGVPRSLDQNAILALAVKTIQELTARIEALEKQNRMLAKR